jgi:hypothetical protein
MSAEEKRTIHKEKTNVAELIKALENGRIYSEDLPAEQKEKLIALLNNGNGKKYVES